jgi:oxygen-independent coproporphyrinogen III oxidase
LNEGLDLDHFQARFGASFEDLLGDRITDLVAPGLVEYLTLTDGGRRLRLTDRGRLVGNEVFGRFLD